MHDVESDDARRTLLSEDLLVHSWSPLKDAWMVSLPRLCFLIHGDWGAGAGNGYIITPHARGIIDFIRP